jgi:hypothetical protein
MIILFYFIRERTKALSGGSVSALEKLQFAAFFRPARLAQIKNNKLSLKLRAPLSPY